jgi:REP element-mobilizing transposase RayT
LRFLAGIFAIEVCAYAVMENHHHNVLRTRPDIVETWSDREVASRWLTLFPNYNRTNEMADEPTEQQISALAADPERIAELRKRLSSISWFMGRLNEFIARKANKEDNVKGRFWESRFKCRPLLDVAAIAACMVYVDLNPVRAGLAATPEESDFTSIQQRIRTWHNNMLSQVHLPARDAHDINSIPAPVSQSIPPDSSDCPPSWLCPIESDNRDGGILQMTEAEYLDLADKSGRILRSGKRGAIDPDLVPILQRIGIKPDAWLDTVSRFESKFHVAAGVISSLRSFADQIGRRWLAGISAARVAFADSGLKSA